MLIPSTPASGKFKYWFGYAADAKKWNAMISTLHTKTYPCYSTNSYPNTRSRNPNHHGMGNPSEQPPSPPTSPHPNHNTRTNDSPRTPPPSNNPRFPESSPAFDFTINKISRIEARKLLGVRSNYTKREVVLRYRILARKYHPDKWNSSVLHSKELSADKFKMISNAKDALINDTHNDSY